MSPRCCPLLEVDRRSPVVATGRVLGRGQAEFTQVVLLLFHLPRSDWADDPDQTWPLGRFWNTSEDRTRSNIFNRSPNPSDTAHTCSFHIQTLTRSWLLQKCLLSPPFSAASTDLRRSTQKSFSNLRIVPSRSGSVMISATFDRKSHLLSRQLTALGQLRNVQHLSDFKPKYLA